MPGFAIWPRHVRSFRFPASKRVSIILFAWRVELVGANRAGMFMYLMPFFGSLLAVLFLGERFQHHDLAGFALIMAGIGGQRVAHEVGERGKNGEST